MYKTLTWLTLWENTSLKIKTPCFRLTGMCGSGYSDDCLGREQVCSCLSSYGIYVLFSLSLLVFIFTSCPRRLLCAFLRTGYQIFQAVPFTPIQFPWLSLPNMYTSRPYTSFPLPHQTESFIWVACYWSIISHILPSVMKIYHHFFAFIYLNMFTVSAFSCMNLFPWLHVYFSDSTTKCLFFIFPLLEWCAKDKLCGLSGQNQHCPVHGWQMCSWFSGMFAFDFK